jgi:hypothetical protein
VDLGRPAGLGARAGGADAGGSPDGGGSTVIDAPPAPSPDRPLPVEPDGPAAAEDAPVQPPLDAAVAPDVAGGLDMSAGPETAVSVDAPAAASDVPAAQGCAAPATACSQPGVLLCDGFETSSAGKFPLWNSLFVKNTNGSPANPGTAALVAATPVCRGG